MNTKTKLSRRPKAPANIRLPQQPVITDPLIILVDRRRDFFTHLLEKIQHLPEDLQVLPDAIQAEIRAHSRTQNSEKDLLLLTDYTIKELMEVLPFLLQPPHLRTIRLDPIIRSFISAYRLRQEDVLVEEDADLEYNHRIYRRLQRYVRQHLSIFIPDLPPDIEKTDVPMDQLQKDLYHLHPTDDLFESLFTSYIPDEIIKNFLATGAFQMPTGEYNIRWAVHSFTRHHQFDLIRKILEEEITVSDWKSRVPAPYYEKYPATFWKLQTWDEFASVLDHILRHSMDIDTFMRLYFKKDKRKLIHEAPEKSHHPIHRNEPKLLKIRNRAEELMIARYRPYIPGLATVLLKPVSPDCTDYLGGSFQDYFFPTDKFFHDLVEFPHDQPRDILHITIDIYTEPVVRKIRIFHLLTDGRILPQTSAEYKKGQRYLEEDRRPDRKTIRDFLLRSELSYLAINDLSFLRDKIRNDLSLFLNLLYTDKMDTDKIAAMIEESLLASSVRLEDYLSQAFSFFAQIHPRYELHMAFPEIRERWDMFFYRFDRVMPPLEIWFPRFHVFDETQRKEFLRWFDRNRLTFIQENLFLLLKQNYDFLRIKIPFESFHSKIPDNCVSATTDRKLAILVSHDGAWFDLPRLGQAIRDEEELLDVPDPFLKLVKEHFVVDRITKGFAAILLPNGYELLDETENIIVPKNDFVLPIVPSVYPSEHLPDFKSQAFALLARLQDTH